MIREARLRSLWAGPAGAYAALGFSVLVWGSAFAGIRVGLEAYTPGQVALLRFLAASLVLVALSFRGGIPRPRTRDLPAFFGLGFLGIAFYNVVLGLAQRHIPSGQASFLVATAPVWMALVASALFAERLRWAGWAGIGISVLGISLIAFAPGGGFPLDPYALVALLAALAQGMFFLGQKPLLHRYRPREVATLALWAGTLLLLPFLPGLPGAILRAPLRVTAAVVYLGVFPGALGYVTWSYGLSKLPAPIVGSFLYLVPPVALLVAWLWLGEVPRPAALAGGGIVLAGVVLVSKFGREAPRSPAPSPCQDEACEGF